MGPLATADFLHKLVEDTPATRDQDHIPVIAYSVPDLPDRTRAILSGGESPLPQLLDGIRVLANAGADAIAIVCNTAHFWYDDLAEQSGLPIIHIADAVVDTLGASSHVGLIATAGTIAAGFYQTRLAARHIACVVSTPLDQDTLVTPAIECVKRHDLDEAHRLTERAVRRLLQQTSPAPGAVILGCTELPVAIAHRPSDVSNYCIDSTRALARACVAWWMRAIS